MPIPALDVPKAAPTARVDYVQILDRFKLLEGTYCSISSNSGGTLSWPTAVIVKDNLPLKLLPQNQRKARTVDTQTFYAMCSRVLHVGSRDWRGCGEMAS